MKICTASFRSWKRKGPRNRSGQRSRATNHRRGGYLHADPRERWTGVARYALKPEVAVMMPEPVLSDLRIPRDYNAATDLIDRNIAEGRGSKPAIREPSSTLSYADLAA